MVCSMNVSDLSHLFPEEPGQDSPQLVTKTYSPIRFRGLRTYLRPKDCLGARYFMCNLLLEGTRLSLQCVPLSEHSPFLLHL